MNSATPIRLNSLDSTKKQLVQNFLLLGDWQQRYAYLVDLGRQLNSRNQHIQTDENRFYGCQANVWLLSVIEKQTIRFEGCSDSVIVAGLMALLFKIYSGRRAEEIINISTDFLEELDLLNNLTSQRSTGLMRMIETMQAVAKQNVQ